MFYRVAYREVMEDSSDHSRGNEAEALSRSIALLEQAALPGATQAQTAYALDQSRALWGVFADDLARSDNALPVELRARLAELALWAIREVERFASGTVGTLLPLIEVSTAVHDGLAAHN